LARISSSENNISISQNNTKWQLQLKLRSRTSLAIGLWYISLPFISVANQPAHRSSIAHSVCSDFVVYNHSTNSLPHKNKTLSDDTDAVLALQGVGWWTRKAIGLATLTLHTKQYEKDGVTHIDIEQTATGGIKGTTEYVIFPISSCRNFKADWMLFAGSARLTGPSAPTPTTFSAT